MLATVFAYGTLMPGHLRWGLIAPFAVSNRPARVDGHLYDTRRGWPAARFTRPLGAEPIVGDRHHPSPTTGTIPGWLVDVASDSVATLLAQLDEVEGAVLADSDAPTPALRPPGLVTGDYRRTRVRAQDGTEAWAYEALVVGSDWVLVDHWSTQAEN